MAYGKARKLYARYFTVDESKARLLAAIPRDSQIYTKNVIGRPNGPRWIEVFFVKPETDNIHNITLQVAVVIDARVVDNGAIVPTPMINGGYGIVRALATELFGDDKALLQNDLSDGGI